MKKNYAPLVFGILLILGGLGYVGSIIFDWNFSIFFDGWWTLFIIVPTFVSILANGPHPWSLVGMLIGVLLLLRCQSILSSHYLAVAVVAIVVLTAGVSLLITFFRKTPKNGGYYGNDYPNNQNEQTFNYATNANNGTNQTADNSANSTNSTYSDPINTSGQYQQASSDNSGSAGGAGGAGGNQYQYSYTRDASGKNWTIDATDCPDYNSILSGSDIKNVSRNFGGAHICVILGGMDLDLRDCVITKDITIYVTSIMGGADIYAPKNVRISLSKTDILGGTGCTAYTLPMEANVPLCTFVTTAILGGIDIK